MSEINTCVSRELQPVKRIWEEALYKSAGSTRGIPARVLMHFRTFTRGCAWPDLSRPASVETQVGWQAATPTCIRVPPGSVHAVQAEPMNCNRDHVPCKASHIYSLALSGNVASLALTSRLFCLLSGHLLPLSTPKLVHSVFISLLVQPLP